MPATLNYRGFPRAICTSINHVVCHGIPNAKPLKDGEIVNIDVTLIVDGWHGDTSRMYPLGAISRRSERPIHVPYDSLRRATARVRSQRSTGDGTGLDGFTAGQYRIRSAQMYHIGW